MPPVLPPVGPPLIGFDALAVLARSGEVRSTHHNGMAYLGVADFLTRFAPEDRDLSQWWKFEKRRLIARDPELGEILTQLKMTAPDGKQRKTEAAPLWACFYIVLMIDTPKANEFKKRLAKGMAMSVEQIKYRARNVAQGSEWAADSIHEIVKQLEPVKDEDLKWYQR